MSGFRLPLLFHLLLPLTLFLQYVQSLPQNSSTVEFLPGFDGALPFYLETGYIGVGKSEEVQLFYYFVKSESNPKKDPLLLWLTGGPGCSSFTGVAYEVGPLAFGQKAYNGSLPILVSTPYSWTKFASILFLEQPVNTGFSYATTSAASKCTDLQACDQVYEFLLKWFNNHPEFISNPFYVSGDSYSGITVPVIVQLISDGIEAGKNPLINLKGYSLGNPLTFPEESNYQIPFCHGMGLISNELYESLKETCKGDCRNIDPTNKLCLENFKMFKKLVSSINDQQILEPFCGTDSESPNPRQLSGERRSLEEDFIFLKHDDFICRESRVATRKLSNHWANDPCVQEALHVRKGTIRRPWARCRQSIMGKTYRVTFMNSIPYHVNLSSKGYRSLIYSGDHDMVVPFQSTQAWIKYLNYSIIDDWRPWTIDGQVAGYTRSFSNHMTYATVKGGGHTAPEYKREESFHMFKRWIAQQPL
ncbi:serine carboxypeptidase-like 11 isoform X1 [Nicotiana tomentosiformis]|uniref:serine carboxypeptidase-like 11 isoform X1 n=1 Tax=Nicotiana tomentosiformis TaxID=4098 RepID=UPI00051C0736|nr:serine carboxypeptidase-like 11 isoform X1 [Nicotiana tomentosiformis]